jgi:hypothetical protein
VNKNLSSYVQIYSDWITPDICNRATAELKNSEWELNTFYIPNKSEAVPLSGENELDMGYNENGKELNSFIMKRVWEGIHRYTLEGHGFSSWMGHSRIRYNRYVENKLMAKHWDNITTLFDGTRRGAPTLSIVGLLNDNFDGGEFVMWDDDVIKLKAGDLMLFPSTFLYPHQVKPVKSGIRYSYVSWAW